MDDDIIIQKSVKKILELEGYSIDTAGSGREALEKSKTRNYNLALLDIKLPDAEGTDLLKEMSENSPETIKIMITGYPTLENAVESLNTGADAFIIKPVEPSKLLEVIKGKIAEQDKNGNMSLERVKNWIEKQVERNKGDITESKQTKKETEEIIKILDSYNKLLQQTNKQLEKSNDELENYTYVVSHDLKAPLRTIRSFSTFLMEDYGDKIDNEGLEYLKRITNAAENMNTLIEDLLILSRVGRKSIEIERINLNSMLEEIISDLKPFIEKSKAEVVVNRLPTINIQRTWIKQLFMNLIDNGLKFNKSETPRVEVECNVRPKDYLFSVRDNGIGIKKPYLKRVFNLFERLNSKDEYEGTGAGLAICKKVVENIGGKIWVESTHGKGSAFFFTIPRKSAS